MTSPTTSTTTRPASTNLRRIMAEIRELEREHSDRYALSLPDESNLFEPHFTIRGPAGSPYADGVYHGRLVLPPQYPFKPPEIYFSTPNGRFETKKKVCLSVSSFHEETWQPAWGIRTILVGITGFMATESEGSVGSVKWTDQERLRLAALSHEWTCPDCALTNTDILPIHGELKPLAGSDAAAAATGLKFGYEKPGASASPTSSSPPAADSPAPSVSQSAPPQAPIALPQAPVPPIATAPTSRAEARSTATRAPPQQQQRSLIDYVIVAVLVCIVALLARKLA